MRQRWDGSNQSSNTPSYNQPGVERADYAVYRCMVTKVLYADDPANISKNSPNPEVLYEVVILGGWQSGQTLSNCRLASWLGGNDNYSERTLKATTKKLSKTRLSGHDGEVVYVVFNQGHDAYPVIIATGKGISNKIAAKKSEGPRSIEEFNGLVQEINNRGEYTLTMNGGKTTNGVFKKNSGTMIKTKYSSDQKRTTTFGGGLTITEDGKNDKVTMKTAGGVTATLDGKSNTVSIKAGSAEVLIDGASGKISIKGDFIDLGASASDFVTKFTELATAFATHTHTGNLGFPTSPPMAPLLTTVGSQTVKVQS